MVRLTVRLSEADQFAVDLPAARTTAGAATRTLARLHNLRLTIARLRAEAVAAARAAAEAKEAAATIGEEAQIVPTYTAQLDDALSDLYDAAALRGSKAALTTSSSPPLLSARDVAAKLAAVAAAAAAASLPSAGGAAAFLHAIEQAEAEAAKAVREAAIMGLGCEQQQQQQQQEEEEDEEDEEEKAAATTARLPPREAACWFAGRALQPADATLATLLGGGYAAKADRTRAVVRLTRGVASGAPARPGALLDGGEGGEGGGRSGGNGPDAETRRAMLAWCLKRQEQLARLDEAARDGEDDHCDAPWADPSALRRELTGVAGGVRWRC